MKAYRYIKVSPVTVTVPLIPFFSIVLGLSMLVWVAAPIVSFMLFYVATGSVITPLSDDVVMAAEPSPTSVDFSKASNWFPEVKKATTKTTIETYTISIPKVRIERAQVRIGSDDLSSNLIHYGGSGLPGTEGTAVVFGHSVLPSFYDPKNYLTIFSLLPTLKVGDDIFVHFDGVDYRYEVIESRITTPGDVSGLEQRFDDSYLTLVTCVPPGTYLKRLWLTAKRKPFGSVYYESSRN